MDLFGTESYGMPALESKRTSRSNEPTSLTEECTTSSVNLFFFFLRVVICGLQENTQNTKQNKEILYDVYLEFVSDLKCISRSISSVKYIFLSVIDDIKMKMKHEER